MNSIGYLKCSEEAKVLSFSPYMHKCLHNKKILNNIRIKVEHSQHRMSPIYYAYHRDYTRLIETNRDRESRFAVGLGPRLCLGNKRIDRGRPLSGEKSELVSPNTVFNFGKIVHLPMKSIRGRYVYCSTKETKVRSHIEYFTCKSTFYLKEEKTCFLDYQHICINHFDYE